QREQGRGPSASRGKRTLNRVAGAPVLAKAEAEAATLKAKRANLVVEREAAIRLVAKATEEYGDLAAELAGAKANREGLTRQQAASERRRREGPNELKTGFPPARPPHP